MQRSIGISRLPSLAFCIIAALAGNAFSATFTNSTPITIPSPGSSAESQISVSGIGNSISFTPAMSVAVSGLTVSDMNDISLVLVGPTGAALVLQGDCGSTNVFPSNLNLAYSDDAASLIPQNSVFSSGTYKPTQYASVGSFPSPGPGTSYQSPSPFGTTTLFNAFDGTNPNGTWSLFAMDPVTGDTGQIANGWTLQINAIPEPASLSLIALVAMTLTCRRRSRVLQG